MFLLALSAALAQDPAEHVVARPSHFDDEVTPVSPPVCRGGGSGGANVSALTDRVLEIRTQVFPHASSTNSSARCGKSVATVTAHNICAINAGVEICVGTDHQVAVDDSQCTLGGSRERALETLVAELETCPGVKLVPITGRESRVH